MPCSEGDYKRWSPSDERGNGCLLGREMVYKRRSPHATCFNGEDFDRPVTLSNCSCTRQDYEWYEPKPRFPLLLSFCHFIHPNPFCTTLVCHLSLFAVTTGLSWVRTCLLRCACLILSFLETFMPHQYPVRWAPLTAGAKGEINVTFTYKNTTDYTHYDSKA